MEDGIRSAPSESVLKPLLASSISFACNFQMGAVLGQSSVMLPQLQSPDSPIQVDEEYASWIVSIVFIGAPITSIFCGPLADKLGRKAMIKMYLLLSAVGHTMVGVSSDVPEILIGRFCLGVAAGFAFPSFIYISEISPTRYRYLLLALGTVWSSVGLLYVTIVGGILPWDLTSLITSSLSTIALILAFFVPETPRWLFQNHRLRETIDSLKWLKGEECNIDNELKLLKDQCNDQPIGISVFQHLKSPYVKKPFVALLALAILQSGAGYQTIISYSINFLGLFKAPFDPLIVAAGLATVRLVSTSVALYFQCRTPRKVLGVLSGFSVALVLGVIYAYTYVFKEKTAHSTMYPAIIVLCFALYIFSCSFGLSSLPLLVSFEIYPVYLRSLMFGVSSAFCALAAFLPTKLFFVFVNLLGFQGMLLVFLIFAAGFGFFSLLILPETLGGNSAIFEEGFNEHKPNEKNIVV